MCISDRPWDRKTRLWMAVANLALFSGLMLWLFARSGTRFGTDALHFVGGLLLGISIAINLTVVIGRRRRSGGGRDEDFGHRA